MALKYLVPCTVFIVGIILMGVNMLFHMNYEYLQMSERAVDDIKMIGNRLSHSIEKSSRNEEYRNVEMLSLLAPYFSHHLTQIEIFDASEAVTYAREVMPDSVLRADSAVVSEVRKNRFSQVGYDADTHSVAGYFPLQMPKYTDELYSRRMGVLFVVFDYTREYDSMIEKIIRVALFNAAIVMSMVVVLSFIMYYTVLRRLNALHKATGRIAAGEFNTTLQVTGDDELSRVMEAFNAMALRIDSYQKEMESKVLDAVNKRTEQTQMLIQQSRMAAMGEMIGNIAHQWRQPLNTLSLILQKTSLFQSRGMLSSEELYANMESGTKLINSMSTTIDDFRDFFKPDRIKERYSLTKGVEEAVHLIKATLDAYNVTVTIDAEEPFEIFIYRSEFSQVILNLIKNAFDIYTEKSIQNPHIHITLCRRYDEEQRIIEIAVSDNAGGVDEAIIDRIFEPYFTTKEKNGTGIGLYMSIMIIETHIGGTIRVENRKEGACFIIAIDEKEVTQAASYAE